ncbi:alpha/beta hydrolase [Amycolatopsis sp. cg5]|uniref:alpha/beta hydrolase n=1 Tax=Amycolatopsis sp. cg5 TaxID=3238802 RepID=UPI0035232F87
MDIELLEPEGAHTATIIWLHGIGQDNDALLPIAEKLGLARAGVRGVFPRAPERLRSKTKNIPVRAWFDQNIYNLGDADLDTLAAAESQLRQLVAAEAEQVGADRVLLAGFSQGAAMALLTALRYPERLAGALLYAPYLVTGTRLTSTLAPSNAGLPVWIGHGRDDLVIPVQIGGRAREILRMQGYPVEWHWYPAGHVPFEGALDDVRAFLGALGFLGS